MHHSMQQNYNRSLALLEWLRSKHLSALLNELNWFRKKEMGIWNKKNGNEIQPLTRFCINKINYRKNI